MRDLKRRRKSYRGIHNAKKSYIEVGALSIEELSPYRPISASPVLFHFRSFVKLSNTTPIFFAVQTAHQHPSKFSMHFNLHQASW